MKILLFPTLFLRKRGVSSTHISAKSQVCRSEMAKESEREKNRCTIRECTALASTSDSCTARSTHLCMHYICAFTNPLFFISSSSTLFARCAHISHIFPSLLLPSTFSFSSLNNFSSFHTLPREMENYFYNYYPRNENLGRILLKKMFRIYLELNHVKKHLILMYFAKFIC